MLPPVVEKRSLIGFLRRIVTDELLSQFVWEANPAEGKSNFLSIYYNFLITKQIYISGLHAQSELSKYYNFQSLIFSLVNKFKGKLNKFKRKYFIK